MVKKWVPTIKSKENSLFSCVHGEHLNKWIQANFSIFYLINVRGERLLITDTIRDNFLKQQQQNKFWIINAFKISKIILIDELTSTVENILV